MKTLLMFLLVLTGCGIAGVQGKSQSQSPNTTILRVENRNWSDVTIYLSKTGASPRRIGRVRALASTVIELENFALDGRYYILLRPLAASGRVSYENSAPASNYPEHDSYMFPGDPAMGAECMKLIVGDRLRGSYIRQCLRP